MVKELHVHADKDTGPSWEQRTELWLDLVLDEIPLPEGFRESLVEEYQHLVQQEALPPQHKAAWSNYLQWVGDVTEDSRSPRERLEAYFAEQEKAVEKT
jgi:hypothetical protein